MFVRCRENSRVACHKVLPQGSTRERRLFHADTMPVPEMVKDPQEPPYNLGAEQVKLERSPVAHTDGPDMDEV